MILSALSATARPRGSTDYVDPVTNYTEGKQAQRKTAQHNEDLQDTHDRIAAIEQNCGSVAAGPGGAVDVRWRVNHDILGNPIPTLYVNLQSGGAATATKECLATNDCQIKTDCVGRRMIPAGGIQAVD